MSGEQNKLSAVSERGRMAKRLAVVGLILSTAALMFLSLFVGVGRIGDRATLSLSSVFLFLFLMLVAFLFRRIRQKSISPVFLIVLSGVAGVILFR